MTLQRQKGRPGYLSGVDYTFMRKVKDKEERQEKLNARKKCHYEQCAATFNKRMFVIFFNHTFIFNKLLNCFFFFLLNFVESTDFSDDDFSDEVPNTTEIDCLPVPSTESNANIMDISQTKITIKTRGRKEIMTAKLSSALDRCKISDREQCT